MTTFYVRPTSHNPVVYESIDAPDHLGGLYVVEGGQRMVRITAHGVFNVIMVDKETGYFLVKQNDHVLSREVASTDLHQNEVQRYNGYIDLLRYIRTKVQSEVTDNHYTTEALAGL